MEFYVPVGWEFIDLKDFLEEGFKMFCENGLNLNKLRNVNIKWDKGAL